MAGVKAQAQAGSGAAGLDPRGELVEGAPQRASGAGRVLEVQGTALLGGERGREQLAGALDRRPDRTG